MLIPISQFKWHLCLYLRNGGRIRDGGHDFVDELHGDVTYHPRSFVFLMGQGFRCFTLFSNYKTVCKPIIITTFVVKLCLYLIFLYYRSRSVLTYRVWLQHGSCFPGRTDTATVRRVHWYRTSAVVQRSGHRGCSYNCREAKRELQR